MYKDKKIAVVVPAYNEEKLISRVLETMPGFVDRIIVVDDASKDTTADVVRSYEDKLKGRLLLIQHEKNRGVGSAIITGYRKAIDENADVTAVMAGDAQMDPQELEKIIAPVANAEVDYTKGNRLLYGNAWQIIPKYRYLGNAVLSLLTKITSGYWHIADAQSGYTAISLRALKHIDLSRVYKSFGFPNDLLVRLNAGNFKVRDVFITPVYNIGEKSRIRLWKVVPSVSLLLARLFLWRLKEKYVIRDFHPLVFFYALGGILLFLSVALAIRVLCYWDAYGHIPPINALAMFFSLVAGMQSLFFAMWFDMENNRDLR